MALSRVNSECGRVLVTTFPADEKSRAALTGEQLELGQNWETFRFLIPVVNCNGFMVHTIAGMAFVVRTMECAPSESSLTQHTAYITPCTLHQAHGDTLPCTTSVLSRSHSNVYLYGLAQLVQLYRILRI
jgi:hypothetical protein